jgi:hypothetical protein
MISCPGTNIIAILAGTKFFYNDTLLFLLYIYYFNEETRKMELKFARDIPDELRTCSRFAVFKKDSHSEILFTSK